MKFVSDNIDILIHFRPKTFPSREAVVFISVVRTVDVSIAELRKSDAPAVDAA